MAHVCRSFKARLPSFSCSPSSLPASKESEPKCYTSVTAVVVQAVQHSVTAARDPMTLTFLQAPLGV